MKFQKCFAMAISYFNKRPDLMVERLSALNENHLLKSLEFNLISALDFHSPGAISALLYETNNNSPLKTSTNQLIISFYDQVIEAVSMRHSLLAITYELIEHYYDHELLRYI